MQLFSIRIVKTLRKTKIVHFATKQNNVQTFGNLHICPFMFSVDNTFFKKSLFDFIFS